MADAAIALLSGSVTIGRAAKDHAICPSLGGGNSVMVRSDAAEIDAMQGWSVTGRAANDHAVIASPCTQNSLIGRREAAEID